MAFEHFPYTNFHELNLDWVIEALQALETSVQNFVSINAIKYADPIQWDITSQYEKNTVVLDISGNAYLSVQAVPSGVSIDRTDFWTIIGNFSALWENVRSAISTVDEGHNQTASAARSVNTLVWVDNTLLRVVKPMIAGDSYNTNTDGNSEVYTIQMLLNSFNAETVSREEADTVLETSITTEATNREQADKTLQDNIDALIANSFINVKNYGAIGNGIADDTLPIQNAFAACSAAGGGTVYFPKGNYKYIETSTVPGNTRVYFDNCTFTAAAGQALFTTSANNVSFFGDCTFTGMPGAKFILLNASNYFYCNMRLTASGMSQDGMIFNGYRARYITICGLYSTIDSPVVVFNGCSNVEISGLQCKYTADIPFNTPINILDNDDAHTFSDINIHDCYINGNGVLSRGFINVTRVDAQATGNIQPNGNDYLPINNVIVENCTCLNSVGVADGIDVLFCTNVRISKNFIAAVFEGIAILSTAVTCSDNNITDCRSCGIALGDLNIGSNGTNFTSMTITGNTIFNCGHSAAQWVIPAAIASSQPATCFVATIYMANNIMASCPYAFYLGANAGGSNIRLNGNFMSGATGALHTDASAGQITLMNNPGYNPTGVITPPAISTNPVTNNYGVPMRVAVSNGATGQGLKLNGTQLNFIPANGTFSFIIMPGETTCVTDTVVDTAWSWAGM